MVIRACNGYTIFREPSPLQMTRQGRWAVLQTTRKGRCAVAFRSFCYWRSSTGAAALNTVGTGVSLFVLGATPTHPLTRCTRLRGSSNHPVPAAAPRVEFTAGGGGVVRTKSSVVVRCNPCNLLCEFVHPTL